MMIFRADVWCDACGGLKRDYDSQAADTPENEYDSDDYPKGPYPDNQEADKPQHCGAGEYCINAVALPSGGKVGYFFANALTADGVQHVIKSIKECPTNEVVRLWADYYGGLHDEIRAAIKPSNEAVQAEKGGDA